MESVSVGFGCPECAGLITFRAPGPAWRFRSAQLLDDALTWHLMSHVDDFLKEVFSGPQRDRSGSLRPADQNT